MTDGKTRTCGLIGNPVEHTLSPLIHNTLAKAMGNNLTYVPFHVEKGRLGDAVRGAYALNVLGLNVTVPYKSDMIPFLLEVDEKAASIGAVNTLVRVNGGYKGYNTDMPGLFKAMESDGVKVNEESVLLLGAGGVARAVAMMLADRGAKEIIILNRTLEKAQIVADEVNAYAKKILVNALPLSGYKELDDTKKYLAIQATSIGMYPNANEAIIEDTQFYRLIHTAYDIVFNPADTKFMQLARSEGADSFNGLKMLLYQGIIAYELWNKVEIPKELADKVYEKMKQAFGERNE